MAPYPSGIPHEDTTYNPNGSFADFTSAQSHISDPLPDGGILLDVPKRLPFKGNVVKISVFVFLVCVQVIEIFFMSAFETTVNTFYLSKGDSRMHGALLSASIGVIFYFLVSIHLIALLSFFLEFIREKLNPHYEEYYNNKEEPNKA